MSLLIYSEKYIYQETGHLHLLARVYSVIYHYFPITFEWNNHERAQNGAPFAWEQPAKAEGPWDWQEDLRMCPQQKSIHKTWEGNKGKRVYLVDFFSV